MKLEELKEYVEKQIKNLEKSPIKDCLNRGWYEGQKIAYENILKKLNNMEKNNESSN